MGNVCAELPYPLWEHHPPRNLMSSPTQKLSESCHLGFLCKFHHTGMIDYTIGHWWFIQPLTPVPSPEVQGGMRVRVSLGLGLESLTPLIVPWSFWWPAPILMLSQFSSVAQSCPTFCDPMNCSMPGLPAITNSRSSLKFTSIESVMPSSHLILWHPLLLLPPIPPSIRVFSNESTLRMRWPKYWSFSFSISTSKNTHDQSPLGWTDWISLQSKGLSRVFSNTTVQKHQFFGAQPSSQSNSHIHTWPLEKP